MKGDKKAIEKLTIFGKIMYQFGCLRYVEENKGKEPFDKKYDKIEFKFIIRWWHPVAIASLIIVVLLGIIKCTIDTTKDFIKDHSVVSNYFFRER